MNASTKKKLESAGWRVGDAKAFLSLTDAEEQLVEMKLALKGTKFTHRRGRD